MHTDTREIPFMLIARRLKALADPTRLAILHSLCKGEMNVTELVEDTGFNQANVSKHLRILREEGLVTPRREQRRIFYTLSSGLSREVCDLICRSLESKASSERKILNTYWRER